MTTICETRHSCPVISLVCRTPGTGQAATAGRASRELVLCVRPGPCSRSKADVRSGSPQGKRPDQKARARAIGGLSSNVGARRHALAKALPSTYTLFFERLSQRDTVCKNCYAQGMVKRLQAMGTPGFDNWFALKMLPSQLEDPVKRRKPTTYFANSM